MAQKYKQESKKQEVSAEPRSVRSCTHPQRTRRQEQAEKLRKARAKRTDQQQLSELDKFLVKARAQRKSEQNLKERIKNAQKQK